MLPGCPTLVLLLDPCLGLRVVCPPLLACCRPHYRLGPGCRHSLLRQERIPRFRRPQASFCKSALTGY